MTVHNFTIKEKDNRIDSELKELGVKSLRYSGKQITEELENVLNDIEANLSL